MPATRHQEKEETMLKIEEQRHPMDSLSLSSDKLQLLKAILIS